MHNVSNFFTISLLLLLTFPLLIQPLRFPSPFNSPLSIDQIDLESDVPEPSDLAEGTIMKLAKASDLQALLKNQYFSGGWFEPSDDDAFGFENQGGFSSMVCQSGSSCIFNLHIYDGPFKNGESMILLYHNEIIQKESKSFNKMNASLTYENMSVDILRHSNMHAVPKSCSTTTKVFFVNISSNMPFLSNNPEADQQNLGLQFEIKSPECAFHVLTSVMLSFDPIFDAQVIEYAVVMGIFAITEGIALIFMQKRYSQKETYAKRASKGTLALMNAFSLYLAIFTIFRFLNPVSFYVLLSIIYGLLSFLFWPRLIWRVTVVHIRRIDPRRKAKAVVQAYFWMLTIPVIPLLSILVDESIIFYIEAFGLVPQIIHNYQHSRKYHWNFWLICCVILPKAFFVSYIFGDPLNLFRNQPNFPLAIAYLGLLFMQCLMLLIQTKWPRFGNEIKLPYTFLNEKEVNLKEDVCPVCLENLKRSSRDLTRKSLLEEANQSKKMIITPCKHKFHETCLKTWLKNKSECPNCRKNLPILDDEDEDM